jgi:acyl carrier protein
MTAFDRLRDTIATTLGVPADKIHEHTAQADVPSWDSLGHINLMVAIENTFDIVLEAEDFADLTSVPAILAHLNQPGRA